MLGSVVEMTTLSANDYDDLVSSNGTWVLRNLLNNISLSVEDDESNVHITCVDFWDGNLYIGTSEGSILHFVSLPQDDPNESTAPSFIFASRLRPTEGSSVRSAADSKDVQQILLLPRVNKACVLCGGILSFYTLPELSPALGNTVVSNCTWVGGLDLDLEDHGTSDGEVVMLCIQKRMRLVRISEDARLVKNIEFPNCLMSARRGRFSCVANDSSYALLDLEDQRKITLFPISSSDAIAASGFFEDISRRPDSSSGRPLSGVFSPNNRGHGKNASLGSFVGTMSRRQASPQPRNLEPVSTGPEQTDRVESPSRASLRDRASSVPENNMLYAEKPLPSTPDAKDQLQDHSITLESRRHHFKPLICSPSSTEFLLATGTEDNEAGMGIFVNLEGEVVRGTLQFHRYPSSLVIDERIRGPPIRGQAATEGPVGFAFASVGCNDRQDQDIVQIQRWDIEDSRTVDWLYIPRQDLHGVSNKGDVASRGGCSLRSIKQPIIWTFPEVGAMLQLSRLHLKNSTSASSIEMRPTEEIFRLEEERKFSLRLGRNASPLIGWSSKSIWLIVKQPLGMRINMGLDAALYSASDEDLPAVDRTAVLSVINTIQDLECTDETDFVSLTFLRQKSSFILFADLLCHASDPVNVPDSERQLIERLLIEGNVDPRVILTLIPLFVEDIFEGSNGIWIHSGLLEIVQDYQRSLNTLSANTEVLTPQVFDILRKFLQTLRHRKGFGSVSNDAEIFQSVDASLLHLLLERDRRSEMNSKPWSNRAELYALVDSGVDCFDKALELLEQYNRLYVLSRLYGTRKMPGKVLEIWRKIVEGTGDPKGEFQDGENEIRKYLARVKDRDLIEEYGIWLAQRNPAVGVQVFTEDQSKVKLEPQQVVDLLRQRAPGAVKFYLEHLVFGKGQTRYADRLISYYLDNVITVLEDDESARDTLAQTYEAYRALRPPKPTYRQFLLENATPFPWWSDRLRLLELLGGSHGDNFDYDIAHILTRMEPFEQFLVPESIILDGRQGRHQQALKLLIHGLGDYHTAINYCLLGGASMYHPVSGSLVSAASQTREDQIVLFDCLLTEFLSIEDLNDRIERTSELLGRFGSWYDPKDVLARIPDTWSVEVVSGFLISTLRRLVQEKNEAMMVKALSGAENLQAAAELVEKYTSIGPEIEEII